ncbi:MAG: hypothetical protein J6V92_01160 [Bacteroidaceae bacterium]|nr:hypothetical protein [Bacteroidaceae bacterium]
MRKKLSQILLLAPCLMLQVRAQQVEMVVGDLWVEIPAQQTQSELKPGWKIVDYQTKSRLMHYLSGGHATQLADGKRPVLRVTPGPDQVLVDYALIRLKSLKTYRKLPKSKLSDNEYMRLEPRYFDLKAQDDAFFCQPLQPLQPGEYLLVYLSQKPIGELEDLLVYPFSVMKE